MKKRISSIILIVLFLVIFGLGFGLGKISKECRVCTPVDVDFSLFWIAWDKIQDEYVDLGKLDVTKMIYGAISGMINSLEDPHTVFFSPEDTKLFLEDVGGRFEGVGMEISIKEEQLQVVSPIKGTPAYKAGLRPGDKIVKIDGVSTMNITIEEAVSFIRGPKGTEVTLTIFRNSWTKTKDIKIKRAVIEVPSLSWELKENSIAYIKIHQFSENATADFNKAVIEILNGPAQRIILDLRGNPGGYLKVSQDIAGWFLEKGQTVVTEDFGGKRDQRIYEARGSAALLDYPIVILINKGSASASEILASALRDNRGIKLIGETSFGKGSVQELMSLRDGSSLKITIAKWLTPNGDIITDKGLDPDIVIEMTEEDYEAERDPQLDKAIEIVKEIL